MSGSSCVHSDCEDNNNEVHIVEIVTEEDLLIDNWVQFNESIANSNSCLTIPIPERVRNKDLVPISILIYKAIQGHHSVKPLVCISDCGSTCNLFNEGISQQKLLLYCHINSQPLQCQAPLIL